MLNAVREMQSDIVDLLTQDTGSVDRAVDEHRHITMNEENDARA